MARKSSVDTKPHHGLNDVVGIILLGLALLLLVAMMSYDARDIAHNYVASEKPPNHNLIGPLGAHLAYIVFLVIGVTGYLLPFVLLFLGLGCFFEKFAYLRRRWPWALVMMLSLMGLFERMDGWRQLFRKIGSFRGESAFTTWLHRLTVNQVLMHFRKRGVKMEQTTDDGETPIQIVKGTENPNAMPVVDRIALDRAIGQLPPGYRTVFTLHDIEGHEHEEIARMLGCSVGTSKSQLHKARMKLRGLLRQQKARE